MSELTQAEKREKFIKKAKENKARFDKHLRLKKEIFGDIKPEHLKTILENGAIDDLFSLKLIEYVDAFNEFELQQLGLHNVSQQRELLLAYEKFGCTDEFWEKQGENYAQKQVDIFLSQ